MTSLLIHYYGNFGKEEYGPSCYRISGELGKVKLLVFYRQQYLINIHLEFHFFNDRH